MSKGSWRRRSSISKEEFDKRWELAFKKKKEDADETQKETEKNESKGTKDTK